MRSICRFGGLLALALVASSNANAAKETVLHRFQGTPDGKWPDAPLLRTQPAICSERLGVAEHIVGAQFSRSRLKTNSSFSTHSPAARMEGSQREA